MDLATVDTRAGAEAGFTFDLMHPKTGEPTGASITVRGADSDTYQEKFRECQRRRLGAMGRQRREMPNLAQVESDALELVAACIIGWQGIDEHGVPVPFSETAARSLFERFPWIREQVDAAVHERANFLASAAKS